MTTCASEMCLKIQYHTNPMRHFRSLVAQTVKDLLAMQRHGFNPWVGKTPLGKRMSTHCSILAWEIPGTEEPGRLQSTWSKKRWTQLSDWATLVKKLTCQDQNAGKELRLENPVFQTPGFIYLFSLVKDNAYKEVKEKEPKISKYFANVPC